MEFPTVCELFDLSHTLAGDYLLSFSYPYEALEGLGDFIRRLGRTLGENYEEISPDVFVARDARIAPSAVLTAPCIIGHKTEVRIGAYLRGATLIGDGAVIGNSTEIKNAILFDGVQAPHYNYIGDSILGYRAHMGAGAVASNFRADHGSVLLHCGEKTLDTGRRKLGCMLGDRAEIGCHSVLCPGSTVGRDSVIYPLVRVRGTIPARKIVKNETTVTDRITNDTEDRKEET